MQHQASLSHYARTTQLIRWFRCLPQDSAYLYLPEGACKSMVYEYQKLAAQDIRFDVRLAEACMDDRMKLCGSVEPVRASLQH